MKQITKWSRISGNRIFHNHIEDGWSNEINPVGHPSWKSGLWLRIWCFLDYKNRVVGDFSQLANVTYD